MCNTHVPSDRSRWATEVSTETTFEILKKPFSLQFIFNVHGLSYINYLNIQIILLSVFVTPPLFINNTSVLSTISNCHMCLHGFKYILLLHYSQGVEGLHLPTIILIKLTLCIWNTMMLHCGLKYYTNFRSRVTWKENL